MTISTVTGSGVPTTLLTSTATNVTLPVGTTTPLLQTASVTITGNGHTVMMSGRTTSTDNDSCQISILVDGTYILEGVAGTELTAHVRLTTGSHTVQFNAYALNQSSTMLTADLVIIDLGL